MAGWWWEVESGMIIDSRRERERNAWGKKGDRSRMHWFYFISSNLSIIKHTDVL